MNLKIIFEDEDLLVIDKPAGLTVNNSDTTSGEDTIQNQVFKKINDLKSDEEFSKRGGIVHRLDKETSGVLLVAKNVQAFRTLQSQFKERSVKKEYIALSHGSIVPKEGDIVVPVGRLPWNRKKFGILPEGRESSTYYRVLDEKEYNGQILSLVRLFPSTGRTHQIRVHMKYLNHPIFSDFLYGGRKIARADRKIVPRVFLHAYKITLNHPKTGERLTFQAPLPPDLENFLKVIELDRIL